MRLINNFDAGPLGDNVSAAVSGGASGDAFTTVANPSNFLKYHSYSIHGGRSINWNFSGLNGVSYVEWTFTALGVAYIRLYYRHNAVPTVGNKLFQFYSSNSNRGGIQVNTDGTISVHDSSNTAVSTTTNALSTSQWNRIEFWIDWATGATATNAELRLYLGDSATAYETLTTPGFQANGASADSVRLGKIFTTTATHDFFVDSLGLTDVGWLGAAKGGAALVPNTGHLSRPGNIALGVVEAEAGAGGFVDSATVLFSGEADYVGAGFRLISGISSFTSESNLVGAGGVYIPGASSFTSESDLTAQGTVYRLGAGLFEAESNLLGAGKVLIIGESLFTVQSDLTGAGTVLRLGEATFVGESSFLSVTGNLINSANVDLSAASNLVGSGALLINVSALLSAEGEWTGIGEAIGQPHWYPSEAIINEPLVNAIINEKLTQAAPNETVYALLVDETTYSTLVEEPAAKLSYNEPKVITSTTEPKTQVEIYED